MKTPLRIAIVLIPLFFLVVSFALAGAEKPKITFGVYVETGVTGVAATQARPVNIGRKRIMVKVPAVISSGDVLDASFGSARIGAGYSVALRFSNAAGRALALATRDNQGRELVVLYNNKVLYAAKIDRVISNNLLFIPGYINQDMKKQLELLVDNNRRLRKLDGR